MDWTTWWLRRGARTRSHPELGRENPQRPWYCGPSHGRVGRRQVFQSIRHQGPPSKARRWPRLRPRPRAGDPRLTTAGWSSPVARQAHNLKAAGSNPAPATNYIKPHESKISWGFLRRGVEQLIYCTRKLPARRLNAPGQTRRWFMQHPQPVPGTANSPKSLLRAFRNVRGGHDWTLRSGRLARW